MKAAYTLFVTCIIQPGELLQTDKRLPKYHRSVHTSGLIE